MMDAYSFHDGAASLDETYEAMRRAYLRTFARLGLEAFAVEADTGSIGGTGSHEFMVAASVGEDAIIYQAESGYAANVERAEGRIPAAPAWASAPAASTLVHTPGVGSIADVMAFLGGNGYPGVAAAHGLKCVLFVAKAAAGEHRVAAFVRGDREVNEVKLTNAVTRLLGADGPVLELRPMHPEEVRQATGAEPGFAGPGAGLSVRFALIDAQLKGAGPLIAGANRTDHHLVGFVAERDAAVPLHWDDLVRTVAGDACPRSGKALDEKRGIEVGHIFKLGTRYSVSMKASVLKADGAETPIVMGSYGIGVERILAAAVELHHDEHGIRWPFAIAPYRATVVTLGKEPELVAAAEQVAAALAAAGYDVLYDDREERPGVKLKDADLIGIPLRIAVGKRGLAEGKVEWKLRRAAEVTMVALGDVAARARELLAAERA